MSPRIALFLFMALAAYMPQAVAFDPSPGWCTASDDLNQKILACTKLLARSSELSRDTRFAIYFNRGHAYFRKGQYDLAIADSSKAIRLLNAHSFSFVVSQAYLLRGGAYERKGEFDHAISDYNEAIRVKPDHANSYNFRAQFYARTGDDAKAFADAETAIRLNPRSANPHAYLAYVYAKKGNFDSALAELEEAFRLDKQNEDTLLYRAEIYLLQNEPRLALDDFETVLSKDPHSRYAQAGRERARATLTAMAPASQAAAQSAAVPSAAIVTSSCLDNKRLALIVGNSAYPSAYLTNPINDADDVTALLREKLCFKVIEAKDANFATFSQRISEFVEESEGADVALFYYAGHAMQFQQTNYLLPVDAKLANELDLSQKTISAQNVVAALESRAKVSLVFLDSCRNNPIEDEFRRRMKTAQRGFGETRGLAPMATLGAETLIVYATRPNQQAADGSGRNSPFTRAFLEHFATPGKDVELVMRDVTSRVLELTNGQQIPQRLTELRHGLVLLPAR